jgi:hypothetical protein
MDGYRVDLTALQDAAAYDRITDRLAQVDVAGPLDRASTALGTSETSTALLSVSVTLGAAVATVGDRVSSLASTTRATTRTYTQVESSTSSAITRVLKTAGGQA